MRKRRDTGSGNERKGGNYERKRKAKEDIKI